MIVKTSESSHSPAGRLVILFLILALGCMPCACSTSPDTPPRIAISGTRNLRDIGGYPAGNDFKVRQGLIYRSDELIGLSQKGQRQLSELELRRIFDLRNDKEKVKETPPPTDTAGNMPEVVSLPIYHQSQDPELLRRKILSGDVQKGEFHDLMLDTYRDLALDHCPTWATLMRDLAQPNGLPALIHCTHGKDRTGFAIALILLSVGVPRETVMEDYLLSNRYLGQRAKWYANLAQAASFFRTPSSEVRALLEVKPAYLNAALDAIQSHYGTPLRYLQECLQIDEALLEKLRYILLEDTP